MLKITQGVFCVLCAVVLVSESMAVPTAVPYTGRLTYDSGAGYEGTIPITAALYDMATPTPGVTVPIWGPHDFGLVQVDNGIFGIVIGGSGSPMLTSDMLETNDGVWLLLTADGTPMLPAQEVYSVPFALRAADADRVGGVEAAEIATLDDLTGLGGGGNPTLTNDTTTCSGAIAGRLRWDGTSVQVCNGTAWVALGTGGTPSSGTGTSISDPGLSCKAILDAGNSTGDKVYWLDFDGAGTAFTAQQFYCDMTTDGGGWTKLMSATVPFLFTVSNYQSFSANSPLDTNYSNLAIRAAFEDALGCVEWRYQMGNGSGWTQSPTYKTGWRQCHDPFTETTNGSDYTYLFGDESTTCGGFNGLHNKYQGTGFASDVDLTDTNSCWYMMAVPNTLYAGAYLHGYQGVCNCTLNWQSLWAR